MPQLLFKALLLASFCLLNSLNLKSQDISEEDISYAKKCRERYKYHDAVILNSETFFEFKVNKEGVPYVVEKEKLTFLSLRVNNRINYVVHYDINSAIGDEKLLKKNKKNDPLLKTTCGDYQIDGIFYSDSRMCQYSISFSSIGEIKTFEHIVEHKDIKFFTAYNFVGSYPIISKNVSFIIPENINFDIKEFNLVNFKLTKKEESDGKGNTVIKYSGENLIAYKSEDYSFSYYFSYPYLLFLPKSYFDKGKKVTLIETIDDKYKWCYGFVEEEKKENIPELKALTEKLIQGKKTDIEKVKSIYYWVQDNIRYLAFEYGMAGFKPESALKVYQNKYGDCKGMANLTKALLKMAGFDARLTWLGTSSIPSSHVVPYFSQNHMICTLMLKDEKYYLDPTEKYISINDIAERIQGREVMIEDGTHFLLLKTPEKTKDRNKVEIDQTFEVQDKSLSGKGIVIFNGERKTGILNAISSAKNDDKKRLLESIVFNRNRNAHFEEYKLNDSIDRDNPLAIRYSAKVNNLVSTFDDDLYITVSPFHSIVEYKTEKDRISDLNFNEKILEKTVITLKIPEGYKLKSLPEPFSQTQDLYTFLIKYHQKDNSIIYTSTISIDKGIINKEKFGIWNESIELLKEFSNEQIVLTKI